MLKGEPMAKHEVIEEKAEALITPVLLENGVTLVDVEYVKEGSDWFLRYYIDKEGGVNIGDCEAVSRAVSELLDNNDFIDGAYTLEVSSPGLGRPIRKDRDLQRNLGKQAEIRLFSPVEGMKEFTGTIEAYDKNSVTVNADGKSLLIERKNVSLMKEYVDWDA